MIHYIFACCVRSGFKWYVDWLRQQLNGQQSGKVKASKDGDQDLKDVLFERDGLGVGLDVTALQVSVALNSVLVRRIDLNRIGNIYPPATSRLCRFSHLWFPISSIRMLAR